MNRFDRSNWSPPAWPSRIGSVASIVDAVFQGSGAPWVTVWRVDPMHVGVRLIDPPAGLEDALADLLGSQGFLVTVEPAPARNEEAKP